MVQLYAHQKVWKKLLVDLKSKSLTNPKDIITDFSRRRDDERECHIWCIKVGIKLPRLRGF